MTPASGKEEGMTEEENDALIKQGTLPQTAVEAGLVHSLQWAMRALSSSRSALAKVTEERDALRGALERIAAGESEVPGLAHEFYGHAMQIAKKALSGGRGA